MQDALETEQEEIIVSESNAESEDDENKADSSSEDKEHVHILGDEGFELPKTESLQQDLNAIDKQVSKLAVAANKEVTQVACMHLK